MHLAIKVVTNLDSRIYGIADLLRRDTVVTLHSSDFIYWRRNHLWYPVLVVCVDAPPGFCRFRWGVFLCADVFGQCVDVGIEVFPLIFGAVADVAARYVTGFC